MCVHFDPCTSSEVTLVPYWEWDDWFLLLYWDLLDGLVENKTFVDALEMIVSERQKLYDVNKEHKIAFYIFETKKNLLRDLKKVPFLF